MLPLATAATMPQPTLASDALIQQEAQQYRARLNSSLDIATTQNPDKAVRAKQLATQYGIDIPTVDARFDEIDRLDRIKQVKTALSYSPILARQMQDPTFASVAQDDVGNLGSLERLVGRSMAYVMGADGKGGLAKDLEIGLLRRSAEGSAGFFRAVSETAARPLDFLEGNTIGGNPLRRLAEGFSMIGQQQREIMDREAPTATGILSGGISSGVQSLGQNAKYLPLLAFGPAGGAAALTGMVLESGGTSYQKAREKGLEQFPALIYGASDAAIEFWTERTPMSKLVGDLRVGAPLYKMVVNQMAKEIPGEQAATLLQDLNEWAVLNPQKTFKDYLQERPSAAAQTLVATIVGTGGNIAVTQGIEKGFLAFGLQFEKASAAEAQTQALEQLRLFATASRVRERDPVSFERFVQQAAEEGPVRDIYVDARIFSQVAQDAGIRPEQLPPAVVQQLDAALVTGSDLRIPVGEFAAQIAPTEYAQSLMDHLKTDPDGMSRAEAAVYMQEQGDRLKADIEQAVAQREGDTQFKTSIETVKGNFAQQLAAANRFTPEVNDAYATMIANFYGVTAAKVGVTPEQLLERYPLRVQAQALAQGADPVGQRFDQSIETNGERDLVITHSLTVPNLLHAAKMGGLPVPSLAITRKSAPLNNFGGITLIGKPEMADPQGYARTQVFGADIYSPRYPSIERDIDRKALTRLQARTFTLAERMGQRLPDLQSLEREGQSSLERSPIVMAQFLTDQGIAPTLVDQVGMSPERRERLEAFGLGPFLDETNPFTLMDNPAFRQAALAEILSTYVNVDGKLAPLVNQLRTDPKIQKNMIEVTAREVAQGAKLAKQPEIDYYATQRALEAQIFDAELGNDFQQYVGNMLDGITKSERIFRGYTEAGNRRYIPHTLDNVVKLLKQNLRGGEAFSYGVGSLRAKVTPQFKSVAAIRANRDRLIPQAEFDRLKMEIDKELMALSEAMSPGLSLATTISVLEDGVRQGVKRAAKTYGLDISDEAAAQASAFMNKLKALPTGYFEAKILREVSLSEFGGAVVPDDTPPEAIETLRKAGIEDIRSYAANNEADRIAKIGEFERFFFQPAATAGNRGQIAFGGDITQTPSVMTLLKGADLSTFLHESGHFFLEVSFDLAARMAAQDPNAPGTQLLQRDTQVLLDWFGVDSLEEWFNLPMEQKRAYHEQFARGFEAYLFEGKAPSVELQSLFQRFRAWLVNVYKKLEALNVTLSDEVRGVMDRLIATGEQIEIAQQARSMLPLFDSAQAAGMTVEEFAAYQSLGTQATADAIEDLQARTLRDLAYARNARGREIKRLQKEAAARRAEVRIEARGEILSQPVYRAWRFLTNKLSADDKVAVTPPEAPKSGTEINPEVDSLFVAIAKLGGLDRAQVEGQWGWDKKERTPQPVFGKPLLRREGGMGIDAMGEMLAEYGYLPKDENGKYEQRDFEEAFDAEYRGSPMYSVAKNYRDASLRDMRPGEGVDVEELGAGRLDMLALRDLGLPQEIMDLIVGLKMTAKDGIHPDIVAEQFGFSSGDDLVRTLAIAEEPRAAIEALTSQKMLERYGELSTPEAIERAADMAIHNDVRARFVASELRALEKAVSERVPTGRTDRNGRPMTRATLPAAAKEFARQMIERLLVRNLRPTQYASAEARAGRAAMRALAAGDTVQAAVEKRNQLINTYAARAAYEAQAEIEKTLRYLRKFEREGVRKALDEEYLDQIDSILERFDLRTGQSLKSIDKRKSLATWIEQQEEIGIAVDLPEKLKAEAFRQSYKDMSIEELRGLVDSVRQIEHLGRLKEKLLTAADNRRFADVVTTLVRSIDENADGRKVSNRTRDTWGDRTVRLFKGFLAAHRKTASLARELDGFKDGGPMWTYLIRAMNAAGDREASMRAEATERLSKLLQPIMAGGQFGGKGKFFPTLNVSLNRGEQLALALNMGNDGNIQRLLDGRGWSVEGVRPVLQNLSSADLRFVQAVWDLFESYRPQIAAKERRVMGKEPEWVEATPLTVTSSDGETLNLRGGYFPIVYDPRESGRAERQADAEEAKQMMKGAFVAATTRRSFIKSRSEEVTGRPVILTWDALFRGVNDVIHDLAWHEWVIDANRLLRNDAVDKAIRSRYGADVAQQFKLAVRDIAAGDAPNMDALAKVFTPLRAGAAIAGLGFNLMNALIQPLGVTQSMVRVGTRWVAMGVAEWAKSPVGLVRQVHAKSEFMRNRARTQQREVNEIQSVVQGKSSARQKLDALMFAPMQSLQLVADMPTWWGAYQKALAEAPIGLADAQQLEAYAVAQADQAVLDSQSGGQVKDLAAVQRGGQMQKLFTVFYGFFSAAYNLGVERAKATNYRSPLDVMHLAWDFLLLYSVPAVLGALIKEAVTPGDDDDPESLARKLIAEQISYLMGLLVGLREVSGAVQYAAGVRQFDVAYGGPAGLRFIQELDKLGKQIGQGELDRALARSAVNVAGVLLHLPSGQMNRTIDGVLAMSEGKTQNPAAVFFGYDRGN